MRFKKIQSRSNSFEEENVDKTMSTFLKNSYSKVQEISNKHTLAKIEGRFHFS